MFLFTYGTLMDSLIMEQVAGDAFDSVSGILTNHLRKRVRQRVFPAVTPKSGHHVEGRLYLKLTDSAMTRLDRFEGDLYQRQSVSVQLKSQELIQAFAYVIRPEHQSMLSEHDWSLDNFQLQHRGYFKNEYEGFRELE